MFDFAVVKPVLLENGKADKNGLEAILLDVVAGRMPQKRVISGTIADRQRFEVGKCYLVAIEQLPDDPQYGEQWAFKNLDHLQGRELMATCKDLGKGIVVKSGEVVEEPMVANGQLVK